MSSSKRSSIAPAGPRAPVTISSRAIIAETASLTGTYHITINANVVLHPRSKIDSTHGPVVLGAGCIISERCIVGVKSQDPTKKIQSTSSLPDDVMTVVLEDGVVVEPGAQIEAKRIGEGSVIGINVKVGRGAVLGKHCDIGPLCEIAENETVPAYTVVFGNGERRLDQSGVEELKMSQNRKHVETLRKLIPSNLAKWQL